MLYSESSLKIKVRSPRYIPKLYLRQQLFAIKEFYMETGLNNAF